MSVAAASGSSPLTALKVMEGSKTVAAVASTPPLRSTRRVHQTLASLGTESVAVAAGAAAAGSVPKYSSSFHSPSYIKRLQNGNAASKAAPASTGGAAASASKKGCTACQKMVDDFVRNHDYFYCMDCILPKPKQK